MQHKLLFALVAFCLLSVAFGTRDETQYQRLFAKWMRHHKKSYSSDEFQPRYQIWKKNYDYVQNHNQGNHGFTLAMNKFADLTNTEFNQLYKGLKKVVTHKPFLTHTYVANPLIPASVNWTAQGAVTHIKNQGQCGSCWSFSATGSIEGAHEIATGELVSLSEQNLVDCSTAQGNEGCGGGLMDDAFQYVIANGGIDTEASYPYSATGPNTCQYNPANSGATIQNYQDVPSGDEGSLTADIANIGPISVAIDASQNSFQLYSGGVYYEPACSSTSLDHGVLAVGYGTYQGSDYYLVKNSWGTDWGINGYIWMSRNRNNNCGIATSASFPCVTTCA